MSKNSKKQRLAKRQRQEEEKARRLHQRKIGIPDNVTTFNSTFEIPPRVAVNPDISDEGLEPIKYQITFRNLDIDVCDFSILTQTTIRALLKKLKDIADKEPKHATRDRLFRDDINNTGEYTPLFRNLTSDVTLKEIKFCEEGRIFCYNVRHHLNVVAVWSKHANLH